MTPAFASPYSGSTKNSNLASVRDDMRTAIEKVHELEARADALASIVRLFRRGTALIDEVDMVLHPLRSELNFPIGEKFTIPMTTDMDKGARYELVLHLLEALFYDAAAGRSFALEQLHFKQEGGGGLHELASVRSILHDLSKAILAGVKKLSLSVMPRTEASAQRQLLLLNNDYYRDYLLQHFARCLDVLNTTGGPVYLLQHTQ